MIESEEFLALEKAVYAPRFDGRIKEIRKTLEAYKGSLVVVKPSLWTRFKQLIRVEHAIR